LAERFVRNEEVVGSIPIISTPTLNPARSAGLLRFEIAPAHPLDAGLSYGRRLVAAAPSLFWSESVEPNLKETAELMRLN
jgi:hypothetical protein